MTSPSDFSKSVIFTSSTPDPKKYAPPNHPKKQAPPHDFSYEVAFMPRARLELAYGQAVGDFELEAPVRTIPHLTGKSRRDKDLGKVAARHCRSVL
jgi:hypothetical protein